MRHRIEGAWFCAHGALKKFIDDSEFCQPVIREIPICEDIVLADRSSRSSHKNGIVEQNNETFKKVLCNVSREKKKASLSMLAACSS